MNRFSFGYYVDGNFFRRTIEAVTMDDAYRMLVDERPSAEVVSMVQV